MKILIIYASTDGQTEKIAQQITGQLIESGQSAEMLKANKIPSDFACSKYDAAIVGGSIRMGGYPDYLKQFVNAYADWLNSVPSAMFTVCMGINSQNVESRSEASHYGDRFIASVNWNPQMLATFAGAVKYQEYDPITRLIMKRISRAEGGSTDTTHDHEYTDWQAVERFTQLFIEQCTEMESH